MTLKCIKNHFTHNNNALIIIIILHIIECLLSTKKTLKQLTGGVQWTITNKQNRILCWSHSLQLLSFYCDRLQMELVCTDNGSQCIPTPSGYSDCSGYQTASATVNVVDNWLSSQRARKHATLLQSEKIILAWVCRQLEAVTKHTAFIWN